jgi:uncharacterized membrane protein required for colicin V production
LQKAKKESEAVIEAARRMAAKGKKLTIFAFASLISLFFVLSGIVLWIVDIGLQIDRGMGMHFSGLMISSCILIGLGLLILAFSSLLLKNSKLILEEDVVEEKPVGRSEQIKDVLEEFLIVFFTQLTQNTASKAEKKPKQLKE